MKKIKALFQKINLFVLKIWDKADELVDLIAPVAINVVEQIKTVNESTAGDVIELIISKAIKGNADELIIRQVREQLRKRLPEVLEIMRLSMNISKVDDKNLQVKMVWILHMWELTHISQTRLMISSGTANRIIQFLMLMYILMMLILSA